MKDKEEKKEPEKKPEARRRKAWPDDDLAHYKRDKPARPSDLDKLNRR